MEKLKVLIIDDEESTRKLLEVIITKEGFDVLAAENGIKGLEIFKKERPDIVISDLNMPDMNGIDVIRSVKKISSFVQVIIITAYNETDTAISALHEGVLDYLKKPIDMNLLSVAMGRAKEKIYKHKKVGMHPKILIADDEDIIRKRLARELEKEGWILYQAANGEEALEIFSHTKVDIVLLDIKMPKKDGLQTLHEMRQITDDFEALILTGFGDESSAVKAMRGGAINFIKKPIDLDQMIVSVEKAIEKRTTDRSLQYRLRELELAQELITKINSDKEIVIDISDYETKPATDFARTILDVLPVGLVIADKDKNVLFSNNHFKKDISDPAQSIDDVFISNLKSHGIKDVSIEQIQPLIDKVFEMGKGAVENLKIGPYAYITFTPLTVVSKSTRETVIMLIIRGERQ